MRLAKAETNGRFVLLWRRGSRFPHCLLSLVPVLISAGSIAQARASGSLAETVCECTDQRSSVDLPSGSSDRTVADRGLELCLEGRGLLHAPPVSDS